MANNSDPNDFCREPWRIFCDAGFYFNLRAIELALRSFYLAAIQQARLDLEQQYQIQHTEI